MHPDATQHKPETIRYIIGKLKALGVSQEAIAKKLGKSSRALRNYKTNKAKCDYPLQYTLESMLRRERQLQVKRSYEKSIKARQ